MTTASPDNTPRIEITPPTSMADERVQIQLHNFNSKETITIRAETIDDSNYRWESYAIIHVDEKGYADLSTSKPLAGTYTEPDSMGLFWSMKPNSKTEKPSLFSKTGVKPTTITLTAEHQGAPLATEWCQRLFLSPDTEVKEVMERGLAGKFFTPKKPGRYPGVLFLEGSAGGIMWSEQMASLLASHGYATLALAYFHYKGLPKDLIRIPLEYFETAMNWMWEQESVIPDKVAVSGISRGGELVLLLGATFPKIKCVVAYVPSNVAFGVPMIDPGERKGCWTFGGRDVPFIQRKEKPGKVDEVHFKEPVAATPIFLGYYDFGSVEAVEGGVIPVERMNGAVLMITGRDDRMWPSSMMAEMVMGRLRRCGFSHPYSHLSYDGAGHYLQFPYLPSMVDTLLHPVDGLLYYVGGGGVQHHLAEVDSWKRVLEFLDNNYRSSQ